MVPYHLWRLVKAGERAAPTLVELLRDETPTPFRYYGTLTFAGNYVFLEGEPERVATIADLADYALRQIYLRDVGFRSYLPEGAREETILAWEDLISGAGDQRQRGPGTKPTDGQ